MPATLAEGLDCVNERGALLDGPVPTPVCGTWEHRGSERDKDERNTPKAERDRVPPVTHVFRVGSRPSVCRPQEDDGANSKHDAKRWGVRNDSCGGGNPSRTSRFRGQADLRRQAARRRRQRTLLMLKLRQSASRETQRL